MIAFIADPLEPQPVLAMAQACDDKPLYAVTNGTGHEGQPRVSTPLGRRRSLGDDNGHTTKRGDAGEDETECYRFREQCDTA